jgi:hypothetical protein
MNGDEETLCQNFMAGGAECVGFGHRDIRVPAALRYDGFDDGDTRVGILVFIRRRECLDPRASRESRPQLRNAVLFPSERSVEPASGTFLQHHLNERYRSKTKSRRLARFGFLEQQARRPRCHQVQVALVHLDGEVRPIEVRLHDAVGALELDGKRRALFDFGVRSCGKPEPAGPWRCQLRHQTRRELVDSVRRRAVENPVPLSRACRRAANGAVAGRQREIVAFLPKTFPGGAPLLCSSISGLQ